MVGFSIRKIIDLEEALAFDDVLLIPQHSLVLPTQVSTESELCKYFKLAIPVLSAAMDTVTEAEMAIALAQDGALGVIHKNFSVEKQVEEVVKVKKTPASASLEGKHSYLDEEHRLRVAAAVSPGDKERVLALEKAGVDLLVVDTAHGHSQRVIDSVKEYKKLVNLPVVAGNVVTAEASEALFEAGADVVKTGIGGGGICTSRIVAGIGIPQFTAVLNCVEAARKWKRGIISDGGLRYSGDVAKAMAAGACAVMAGGLFARCFESPGEIVKVDGKKFKSYRGMGSIAAMQQGSKARYGQQDVKDSGKLVAEGIEGLVPLEKSAHEVLFQLAGGLRNSMGYLGAENITEFQKRAKFVKVTHAGVIESHPHNVKLAKDAPNYKAESRKGA